MQVLEAQLKKHTRKQSEVGQVYVDRFMELFDCGGLMHVSPDFARLVATTLDFIYNAIYNGEIAHTNTLPLDIAKKMWNDKSLVSQWCDLVLTGLPDDSILPHPISKKWFDRSCELLLHIRFGDFLGDATDELLSSAGSVRTTLKSNVSGKAATKKKKKKEKQEL